MVVCMYCVVSQERSNRERGSIQLFEKNVCRAKLPEKAISKHTSMETTRKEKKHGNLKFKRRTPIKTLKNLLHTRLIY